MKNVLIVIDMQKDFVDGSLGTEEALGISEKLTDYVKSFDGDIIFTRDTHAENYMQTSEGKNLPVPHCIKGTPGHELYGDLKELSRSRTVIDKPTFGSRVLAQMLYDENSKEKIEKITLIGVCTDICVISNALCIKAFLPETKISVISNLCAGTTPENHAKALDVMRCCQISVE